MFDMIVKDITNSKASLRRWGLGILAVGVLSGIASHLGLSGRGDDLQVVLFGFGGLLAFLGLALTISGVKPLKSHPLVHQLQSDPAGMSLIEATAVIRHNAHVAYRLRFLRGDGSMIFQTQLPREKAVRWLDVLEKGIPSVEAPQLQGLDFSR